MDLKDEYDQPLRTYINKDGKLIIEIGIGMLAFAFEHLDENLPYDENINDFVQKYKVTNTQEFAKDVISAMHDEREDGSNPLTDFLDNMCWAAVEDGSIAVDELNEKYSDER